MMLAKDLGVELAHHGIRVNTISLGFVDSDQIRNIRGAKPSKRKGEQMWLALPDQRLSKQSLCPPCSLYQKTSNAEYFVWCLGFQGRWDSCCEATTFAWNGICRLSVLNSRPSLSSASFLVQMLTTFNSQSEPCSLK